MWRPTGKRPVPIDMCRTVRKRRQTFPNAATATRRIRLILCRHGGRLTCPRWACNGAIPLAITKRILRPARSATPETPGPPRPSNSTSAVRVELEPFRGSWRPLPDCVGCTEVERSLPLTTCHQASRVGHGRSAIHRSRRRRRISHRRVSKPPSSRRSG